MIFNQRILFFGLGVFLVLQSVFLVWNHTWGDGYVVRREIEGFEGELARDEGDAGGDDRVNLVNEYAHFRYKLDMLDRKAAAAPKDKEVAAHRQYLEGVLTEIADFIQKEGKQVSGEDAERLVQKIRGAMM